MREGETVIPLDLLVSDRNQEVDIDAPWGRILHPIPGSCEVKDPSTEPLSVASA